MSTQGFLYLRLPYTVVWTNGLFFFHYSPVASRLLPCGHPACKTKYSSLWKARIKQVEEEIKKGKEDLYLRIRISGLRIIEDEDT